MSSPLGRLDDQDRLAALDATALLDTPPAEAFDRLTRLVTRILNVPVALVTLVDRDRQFFKSCIGLPEPWMSGRETPLSHSFCQYTVMTREPLIITDARLHPELRDNLAIRDLGVIAYAGIPLMSSTGEVLGSFCAIDTKPREWADEDIRTLTDLAAAASSEIELYRSVATEHRSAQEAQRAKNERDEFLNATLDGVYTIDQHGICLFANRAAGELLGFAPHDLVGKNIHDLVHYKRADGTPYSESECPINRAARAGESYRTTDEVLWRRDGTALPVAYASSPVRRDGTLIGAVVRFTDITEAKRAERGLQMLAESSRAFSLSLDLDETLAAVAQLSLPVLADMAMLDVVDGGIARRIAASQLDERGTLAFDRARSFPPQLDEPGMQAEVIRTGHSLTITDPDEDWIASSARSSEHAEVLRSLDIGSIAIVPLQTQRGVLGSLTLVRLPSRSAFNEAEVTLAEELGRRAAVAIENARLYESAQKATGARDDMLGVVSHDLRNPVHTIFMSSSFLIDLLPEERKAERQQARIIKRSAERANRLISDLLDITRIESGKFALDLRLHSAAAMVDEVIEQSRSTAEEKGIALERGDVDETVTLRADRDRVIQALGNLVANALKFTPKGGRVTISVIADGVFARVGVADTGAGITEEQLPKLFDRYWQANRLDKRGVGLGLSIVKGIAIAHGGSIDVESTVGEGSVFELRLPIGEPRPE